MILILLLIFAFLSLAVVRQVESRLEEPAAPLGACPGCGCRVEYDWIICPHCKELLQRPCGGCQVRIPVSHHFCTVCGERQKVARREVAECT